MNIINIMNFVRRCDPRLDNSEQILFDCTRRELELVKQYGVANTFLLQYDALIDPRYRELFSENADSRTELGLWLEIVRPLTDACGLPWRGREGWDWDWTVVPGFSPAYTPAQREKLIDECMAKFREIYGFYPMTVGSWLLDTHTANYLSDRYHVSALAICRDQVNTDAYTLVGGCFNQPYYPSRKNIFTPAQTVRNALPVPVFRLLGSDPIHNYDNDRHLYDGENGRFFTPDRKYNGCYTMEPVWDCGSRPEIVDWFFDCYFTNENLGFGYTQLGQENSFGNTDFLPALKMQLDKAVRLKNVSFLTMKETGEAFRRLYPSLTPATSVCALKDFNRGNDVQSAWYNCANYTANVLRDKGRVSLRCLYLFDENVPDAYLTEPCKTWDAEYANLPVVDTLRGGDTLGLVLDDGAKAFSCRKTTEGILCVKWDRGSVVFTEHGLTVNLREGELCLKGCAADVRVDGKRLRFVCKGHPYALVCTTPIEKTADGCRFLPDGGSFSLTFERG